MEKQSSNMDVMQKSIESSNKAIEDSCLISIVRTSEWSQLKRDLEADIYLKGREIKQLKA